MRRSIAIKWEGGGCLGCGCGCASVAALGVLLSSLFGVLGRYAEGHERTLVLAAVAVLLLTFGLLLTARGKSFARAQIAIRKPKPPDDANRD